MPLRRLLPCVACAVLISAGPLRAEQTSISPPPAPVGVIDGLAWRTTVPMATSARLDFVVDIGKFIYLRLGAAPSFPAADGTPAMATFSLDAAAVANAVTANAPLTGTEGLMLHGSAALPVEVRSNAGQVSLRAQVTTPLSSGASVIAMSGLSIRSSDPGLPGPAVPDAGEGPPVLVQATSFGNLVTERMATWVFSLAVPAGQPPGAYAGQVSFIASTP